jgi:hypothetical protein
MEPISLVVIALASLLMLDFAAPHLAGDERSRRSIRRPR